MGRPKALVELDGEPLVVRAVRVLRDGGCAPVVVVLGAAADEVRALLPADVEVVVEPGWAEGMAASLRSGLAALARLDPVPEAALVHLVDLPGVTAAAVARVGPAVHIRLTGACGLRGPASSPRPHRTVPLACRVEKCYRRLRSSRLSRTTIQL